MQSVPILYILLGISVFLCFKDKRPDETLATGR